MQRYLSVSGRRTFSKIPPKSLPKYPAFGNIPRPSTTQDPILRRIRDLSIPSLVLGSQPESYQQVIRAGTIVNAVPLLEPSTPTWLVMHVIANQVHTPAHAALTLPILKIALSGSSTELKPTLIILAVAQMAKHHILTALPNVIQQFLHLQPSAVDCNLMVHALIGSDSPRLIITLLEHMRVHEHRLDTGTYHRLLLSRSTTLALSNLLSSRMVNEGPSPNLKTLTSFMRVFGRYGNVRRARQYRAAVLQFLRSERMKALSNHSNSTLTLKGGSQYMTPSFKYLSSLHSNSPLSSTPAEALNTDMASVLSLASRTPRVTAGQLMTAYDTIPKPTLATFTTLIDGLVRKGHFELAVKIWDNTISHAEVERGDEGSAGWNIGHLDDAALRVGLKALVRAGRAGSAFSLLSHVIVFHMRQRGQPNSANTSGVTLIHKNGPVRRQAWRQSGKYLNRSLNISIVTINALLLSLLRSTPSRPDIVYLVWDHMHKLYAVLPNNVTLDILLQATRIGYREDRKTLRGNLREFALQLPKNPFRRRDDVNHHQLTRKEILTQIRTTCDAPPKSLSIWRGKSAFRVVVHLFMNDMLLRNHPHLRNCVPPAKAVRSHDAETTPWANLVHVARSLYLPFAKLTSKPDEPSSRFPLWTAPVKEEPRWDAPYPGIIPTEEHCAAFLPILALSSTSHLIPQLLAYMRTLDLFPKPRTLGYALILFAPLASRGPLVDQLTSNEDEYAKLVKWCAEWVGEEHMPRHSMFWHYRRELRAILDPLFTIEKGTPTGYRRLDKQKSLHAPLRKEGRRDQLSEQM